MKIHDDGPDMDWKEARIYIGAAEGAIRLLTLALPAYRERERREQLEAWQRANEERKARRDALAAMPIDTFEHFKALVEAMALSYPPWFERFGRPILHFMWENDRVIVCDGENTAVWYFLWTEHTSWESIADEFLPVLNGASCGADWDAECREHECYCY